MSVQNKPDGALAIGWVRRSRAGWGWSDGGDAPLAEEAEHYRVTLTGGGTERVVDVSEPQLVLSAAERPPGAVAVAIVQQGTLAASPPAFLTFDAGA